jgi:hypothetical protein
MSSPFVDSGLKRRLDATANVRSSARPLNDRALVNSERRSDDWQRRAPRHSVVATDPSRDAVTPPFDRSLTGPGRQVAASQQSTRRRESVGSVCTGEQLTGPSARYACSEEHDHECKPSPHRHPSASTSGEKAEQAARADCGSTDDRTGYARSKAAANLFTIPRDDERENTVSAR